MEECTDMLVRCIAKEFVRISGRLLRITHKDPVHAFVTMVHLGMQRPMAAFASGMQSSSHIAHRSNSVEICALCLDS